MFGNPVLLQRLNQLVHPEVIRDIGAKLETFERLARVRVIVDASLMIESGMHKQLSAAHSSDLQGWSSRWSA